MRFKGQIVSSHKDLGSFFIYCQQPALNVLLFLTFKLENWNFYLISLLFIFSVTRHYSQNLTT